MSQAYRKKEVAPGHIAVTPLPTPEELSRFYAGEYYQQLPSSTYQAQYSADEIAQRRVQAELLIHAVRQQLDAENGAGNLLEVGSGEGFVLEAAAQSGFEVRGIDFSDFALRKFHPHLADRLTTGDAYQLLERLLDQKQRFSALVLKNVLEHVIDPGDLLTRARGLLLDRAIVAATVPNDYSRIQEMAAAEDLIKGEYWFAPPQHLHYFTQEGICRFAERCGYEVLDVFGDFPIEFFLFHPGANYALDPKAGKAAHNARITLDLLLSERGLDAYLQFYRGLAACGMGRNTTVLLRPVS